MSSNGTARSLSPELFRGDLAPDMRRGSIEWDFALEHLSSVMITGQTLRSKIEGLHGFEEHAPQNAAGATNFEVAPGVFAIGSLTGDSLIRFAVGGCTAVAAKIMQESGKSTTPMDPARTASVSGLTLQKSRTLSRGRRSDRRESNPLERGHASPDALDGYAPRAQAAHLMGQDHAAAEQAAKPQAARASLTHRRKGSVTEILPEDNETDDYGDEHAQKEKCTVS